MSQPLCLRCAQPVADNGRICSPCWFPLERDLGDVTWLAEQLDITLSRQSRTAPRAYGSRSRETPVAFDPRASEVAGHLRAILVSWARMVIEERGWPDPPFGPKCWPSRRCAHASCLRIGEYSAPPNELVGIGRYLLGQSNWLRHHPAASDALEEITTAIRAARQAVDAAPEMLTVGPCDPKGLHGDPCTQELRVRAGREFVECAACGLTWRVADRREYLVEAAQELLVTAYVLSRFLAAYGEPLNRRRITRWADAGHIVSHGCDARGNALYKIGEVQEVLTRVNELRRKKVS